MKPRSVIIKREDCWYKALDNKDFSYNVADINWIFSFRLHFLRDLVGIIKTSMTIYD